MSLQYMGKPLSAAGDVNGDGFDDVLVGSPGAGTLNQGYAYLVFGGTALPAGIDLESDLAGEMGVVYKGALTGERGMHCKVLSLEVAEVHPSPH